MNGLDLNAILTELYYEINLQIKVQPGNNETKKED